MIDTQKELFLKNCKNTYLTDLTENILPFWLENGMDNIHGGLYTCLDRIGKKMDSTKSVWFQGRFAYVLAYAYNHIKPNAEWLIASKNCIDFLERHCFDEQGHMYFEVMCDGTPLRKRRYVFSECFTIIAMAEYAKASKDEIYAKKAFDLLMYVLDILGNESILPSKYLDTVKMRGHSITMILINTAMCVRQVYSDAKIDTLIMNNISDLENYFINEEYQALLETVGENGEFIDTIIGRTINPGHSIETAWFLMEVAQSFTQDKKRIENLALKILDWSWKWGWDEKFGGIINFKDCKGFPAQDYSQDMKFWWPQCESMIATLYAYKITKDEKYLDMFKLAHEWAYTYLVDSEHREWYGYLHRDGSVAQPAKGNIFKGPFHIPRMMVKCHELCTEILSNNQITN